MLSVGDSVIVDRHKIQSFLSVLECASLRQTLGSIFFKDHLSVEQLNVMSLKRTNTECRVRS